MSNFWDDILPSNYYDKNLKNGLRKNRGIQSNWHNLTFLKVKSQISKSNKHLDYACGPGSFIGLYLKNNSIGVDVSKNQIDFAINKYHEQGQFMDLSKFDFKNYKKYFDSISVIGLFEYLDDNESIELLEKFNYILKDHGVILITTPNYSLTMRILEYVMHKIGTVDYSTEHKNKHNALTVNKLLSESSYEYEIKKILNLGIFFSVINLNFGQIVNDFIEKISFNKFGFLFFIKITKSSR